MMIKWYQFLSAQSSDLILHLSKLKLEMMWFLFQPRLLILAWLWIKHLPFLALVIFHLRNIFRFCKYLTKKSVEVIIHVLTTKVDYCNSLMYGLPKRLLSKLQSIQNSAARIVTLSWKYDHFTPLLIQLHWLPVRYRIVFKILLIVYKSMNGDCPSYLPTILLLATLNI